MGYVMSGTVILHGCTEGFFHLCHMLFVSHFNEVDDHLATDIAQFEMAGNGFCSFHICFVCHGFKIAFARNFTGININSH